MIEKIQSRLVLAVVCLSLLSTLVLAQDFQRSYRVGAGSRVSVRNVSGDVIVKGYEGDTVTVVGDKEGRDRDLVQIEDNSSDSRVDVRVRYPERCNCDASVRFEVRVPRSLSLDYDSFSSVSGNVEVSGATGSLTAKSVSGSVRVENVSGTIKANSVSGEVHVKQAAGAVSAKSTSGAVDVEIVRLGGEASAQRMEFASVSGNVNVRMPADLGAEIEMSTLSGSLETEFPIQIQERQHGPGHSARGRVGDGSRGLKISSVSGNVKLRRM
jgi:hypothetical protein